jgi:NTP pyrophosphatase (non-canonical NTP hydrolase)
MNTSKLQEKIIEWAAERGIFEKATPIKQAYKTLEECGELIQAISEGDKQGIRDAIGDIIVTLIIQAAMQDFDIEGCLQDAYNEIKDRKGKMVNGTFVKEA